MGFVKIKALFDATGAFLRWTWKYPTTPVENFQDARFRYLAQTDPELKNILDDLTKHIKEHDQPRN